MVSVIYRTDIDLSDNILTNTNKIRVGSNTDYGGRVQIAEATANNIALRVHDGAGVTTLTIKGDGTYETAGNILPFTDLGADIGSASKRFNNLYVNNLSFTDIIASTIKLDDGTAASPSYTFDADTDVGIFRAGTNILAFSTSGTEQIRIAENGNVGFQNNNPQYAVDISGDIRWSGTLQGGTVPWARLSNNPSVIAGAGLINGGVLTSDVTLDVGAGFGITVNANDVAFDGSQVSIDDLKDVAITSPQAGQRIEYDGTNWVNVTATSAYASSDFVATGTYTFNHNLGGYPEIQVYDTTSGSSYSGHVVYVDISYSGTNYTILSFNGVLTGKVIATL